MPLVLLVEDDHAVRTAMTGALRDAGYVVQPVANALDALRTVTEGSGRAPRTSPRRTRWCGCIRMTIRT